MSGFEWFLLIVVVIAVPLVVAVAVTLWTLEQARSRNRQNREGAGTGGEPVKRRATREPATSPSVPASGEVAIQQSGTDERPGDVGKVESVDAGRAGP
jgi:hypothetical protein